MSYIETLNLIDFGTEDVKQTTLEHKVKESIPSTLISKEHTPTLVPHVSAVSFSCLNVTSQEHIRESLDNNPFDSVQKLANRPDDPFEIVEKEACQKARSSQIPVDVKIGNLLSLSDDNLLDDVDTQLHDKFSSCITENNNESPKYVSGSITAYSNGTSSIYNTANTCNILDSESPPISFSQKWTTDSGNSSESVGGSASSTDAGNSAKTKKAIEYRKRLLKLSISNSTFNSPVSRRMPQQSDDFAETNNISMILTEAAQVGEHLIAAESPLKLVDDDLMAEEPNWIDSEKDFDDDLEMLKIPMLKELPSPIVEEQKSLVTDLQINADEDIETKDAAPLTDLAAIRAKLKAKRELSNNNQDISLLIDSLKSLIADINVGDANKKQQAASLLDTLSSALSSGGSKKSEEITTQQKDAEVLTSVPQPQPIVRQGTFDIELQEKEQQKNKNSDEYNGNFDQDPSSPQSVQTGKRYEEMPDAMIKSSATYDGENTDEKQDFILPEIQPLTQSQLDVNDIVDQLGKLLEQHQLNNKHNAEIGADGGASQAANINPTFIVVMNTTPATLTTASVQQHCSYMASCLENSFNDGSPTINSHSNSMMRRRSQSLSIHDKIKVLQLPMISNNVVSTAAECDHQVNVSPEVSPFDAEDVEFKTPSRAMVRRNSFSSGTPFTPIHSHFGTVAAQRRASGMSDTSSQIQMRRPTTLTTHHESQLNLSSTSAIVRPMQHLNLNSLKPDLTNKKKFKSSNTAESILKSSGPMKATIPVKKVAPMLKPSQPLPDSAVFKTKSTSNLNSSMQLTAMSGKIPHTSTPMPQPRGATVALDIAPGLPNACSTPSVRTSPMKRSMTNASKRYSYLSATPSVKRSVSTSATVSGLRRRTLSELKPKSPIKPRISSIGGAASIVTNSTGKTTGVARNSAKITSNVSRTVQNKSAPTPSTRTSSRLSSRTSFAGTTAPKRNKENKQP